MATPRHRYVDPNATGSGVGTSWTNAYTSLNTAEQTEDNTGDIRETGGSNEIMVFHCRSGSGTADGTAASISGWTTDAGGYIVVVCDATGTSYLSGETDSIGGRHGGVWTTSKYRIAITGGENLTISEEYVRISGLQLAKTNTTVDTKTLCYIAGVLASNDLRIDGCILKQFGSTFIEPGFYINDTDAVVTIWNCLAYGSGSNTAVSNSAFFSANGTSYLYGCTFIGGQHGVRVNLGSVTAKNSYAYGASAGWSNNATLTTTYCASNTAELSGTGDVDNVPYTTATFVNVTAGTEDFRLAGTGSGLYNVGTTLTDDPPGTTALSTDIAGQTRA